MENKNDLLEESPIFVLGIQRSGTTWLANIFDSSPDTVLLFEPFAPKYNIFEQFPHEFLYVSPPSVFLSELIKQKIPKLIKQKSLFFDRIDIGHTPFAFERFLVRSLLQLDRLSRSSRLDFARQYQLLNLNRMDQSGLFFPKKANAKQIVFKELRLNFKVDLLMDIFPNSRFLYIIRHPIAVVNSIMSWMDKGHLSELRQNLDIFIETISGQLIFQPYLEKIQQCKNKGLEHKLALFWLLNSEIVLKQFEKSKNSKIVIYEELAHNPLQTIEALFDFLHLNFDPQVESYARKSSTASKKNTGIIDTERNSAEYYKNWQEQVTDSLNQIVLDIVADSQLLSEIEQFY